MEIKKEVKDGVAVIYLSGNLLGENANGPVLDYVKQQLEGGVKKVLFNLTDLKYINSTGLGMLMTTLAKVKNAGGEMYLCNVPDLMTKILKMMKLESAFSISASEEEAVKSLA
ncbi:MAG: STAS domain-containing protein [Bacteroidetes bacterium]|nr:STAS domain-containing protein [Bacteroidota bacterium]MBS1685515.1 STAS domain-containing protein [Bacteroidota bacterium]